MTSNNHIRVLVVDDSALVRSILSQGLSLDPEIEVVGTANDPYIACDKISKLQPDVLTLDVEMPKMDGVEFLKQLMPQHPIPVLMVSALTKKGKQITLEALEAGAVDFVTKPSTDISRGLNEMLAELRQKVKVASRANVGRWLSNKTKTISTKFINRPVKALSESTDKVIAIGASTGGTEAIRSIITNFPASAPGTVIVQHMPSGFTRMFAERLNDLCQVSVKEAAAGDRIMTGHVLIAPGDYHLTVNRSGGNYIVDCKQSDKVCGHRPSVEILFQSVAKNVGSNSIGAILTGMGHDGADGMVAMRKSGAYTLAQDEATSVVFGMPKEALKRGGTDISVPLEKIPEMIINHF